VLKVPISLAVVAALLAGTLPMRAEQRSEASPQGADPNYALKQATSPIPTTVQLDFQPMYTWANGATRYVAQLLFQPFLPYEGFFLPGLDVPGFRSIARLQLLAQSQQIGGVSASGLTDLQLVDGVVHNFGPLGVAGGFGTVFPMATSPALGMGKLQVGPALAVYLDALPFLTLGSFGGALWSVAGDSNRPATAWAFYEPLIQLNLPGKVSVFTEWQMNFFWEGGQSTVPINLAIAHDFNGHFVGALQAVYTVWGQNQGAFQGVVVLNFQPNAEPSQIGSRQP
jgi:hypothetical protein